MSTVHSPYLRTFRSTALASVILLAIHALFGTQAAWSEGRGLHQAGSSLGASHAKDRQMSEPLKAPCEHLTPPMASCSVGAWKFCNEKIPSDGIAS